MWSAKLLQRNFMKVSIFNNRDDEVWSVTGHDGNIHALQYNYNYYDYDALTNDAMPSYKLVYFDCDNGLTFE